MNGFPLVLRQLLVCAAFIAAALSEGTSWAARSAAFDFTASFNIGGVTVAVEPINAILVPGSASSYDKALVNGPFRKVFNLAAGGIGRPQLTVSAGTWGDNVSVSSQRDGIHEPRAGTYIQDFSLYISGPVTSSGLPYLHIEAQALQGTNEFSLSSSGSITTSRQIQLARLVVDRHPPQWENRSKRWVTGLK